MNKSLDGQESLPSAVVMKHVKLMFLKSGKTYICRSSISYRYSGICEEWCSTIIQR